MHHPSGEDAPFKRSACTMNSGLGALSGRYIQEFDSRPVFVWKNEHIDAHFTTCFTALVLIRLLQTKLENKYPVGQMISALKNYCCVPLDANTYQITYYDKVLESCAKIFDMELDNKYRTRQQIQRLLRY